MLKLQTNLKNYDKFEQRGAGTGMASDTPTHLYWFSTQPWGRRLGSTPGMARKAFLASDTPTHL